MSNIFLWGTIFGWEYFKSLKKVDPNGQKLHQFITNNFRDFQKKFRPGKNRINIHFDPLSLI